MSRDDYMKHWAGKLCDPGLQLKVMLWRVHFCIFTCLNGEHIMRSGLLNRTAPEDEFLQDSLDTFIQITVFRSLLLMPSPDRS